MVRGEQTRTLLPFDDRNCRCGLAVVLPEQVRIDAQGDVRLAVAQALADGHDINTLVDQLRGKLI